MEEIGATKSPPVLFTQLSTQRVDNLFAIPSSGSSTMREGYLDSTDAVADKSYRFYWSKASDRPTYIPT